MAGCKPAESLLAEREQERERSGRLAKRRLEAGGYTCAAFLLAALLLRRLRIGCNVLLAAAAAFNGSQAGVYFAGSRLYHCTCSYAQWFPSVCCSSRHSSLAQFGNNQPCRPVTNLFMIGNQLQ